MAGCPSDVIFPRVCPEYTCISWVELRRTTRLGTALALVSVSVSVSPTLSLSLPTRVLHSSTNILGVLWSHHSRHEVRVN